jgi:hypothetical protein
MFALRAQPWIRRPSVSAARGQRHQRYRPWVEMLESREAPAVFNITNGDTAGLIAAITTANANNQADTINLAAGGTYALTAAFVPDGLGTALPQISLDGSAANTVTLNGNGATLQSSAAGFRCLWVTSGVLLANNLTVQNFTASAGGAGGALVVGRSAGSLTGQATFTNVTFTNNASAIGDGVGNVYGPNSSATFNNCTITNNKVTAGTVGGGAFGNSGTGSLLNLNNCTLTGNSSSTVGGVIQDTGTNTVTTLTNCTVSGNSAGTIAAGIYVKGSGNTVTITGSTFFNNTSNGSAVLAESGTNSVINIANSAITGNTGNIASFNFGSTLTMTGMNSQVTVTNTLFDNNQGLNRGCIYQDAAGSSLTIVGSTFSNNKATQNGYGGAVSDNSGKLTITNCTLVNNVVTGTTVNSQGGALSVNGSDVAATIRNSTLTGNTATATSGNTSGGAIRFLAGSLTIVNSIVAGNSSTTAPDLFDPNNAASVSFSLIGVAGADVPGSGDSVTATATNGNIVNVSAGLSTLQNNGGLMVGASASLVPLPTIAPQSTSTVIDAGSNALVGTGITTDERGPGFNRIINNRVDMGAFEFQPPATTTALISSLNPASFGQSITFTVTVTGNTPGSNAVQGTVTFLDNGKPLATVMLNGSTATITTAALTSGSHTITAQYDGFTQGSYSFSASMATLTQTVTLPTPPAPPPSAPPPPPVPAPPPPVPAPPPLVDIFVTGSDAGSLGAVSVYDAASRKLQFTLLPFGPSFTGGVRVAVGDVNGDGVADIICAAGPGGLPEVLVYDGTTGQPMQAFLAFSGGTGKASSASNFGRFFTGGVFVAAGDVNGDGFADIIVGADAGGGPQIQVISGKSGTVLANFFAFGLASFRGGVRVAAGDVNGDGRADIIAGAGAGGGPQVQVYDGANLSLIGNFFALAASFTGGVFVAAGDVNGDGRADIIAGAGAGGGPQVTVFDGSSLTMLASFFAYNPSLSGGVHVAVHDVNGNAKADILTGPGNGGLPEFEAFDGQTQAQLANFFTILSVGGIFVG